MTMPNVATRPVMPAGALINPQSYALSNTGPMAEQVSVGSILSQLQSNPPDSSRQGTHDCGLKCSEENNSART